MKAKYLSLALITSLLSLANVYSQSTAKLIVYRPASSYGSLAKYQVNVDDKEVTTLKSKSMYEMELTPGNHTVSTKQANRAVTINAQPGQTYVVEYKTPLHILGAKPKLKVVPLSDIKGDKRYQKVSGTKMDM